MTSAAANNPQALLGATLAGVYSLDRLLNEGRHGALFDARHVRTGARYAVRLLRADAARRTALTEHLKKVAAIVHPHLQAPHEVQVLPDDQLLIATPFLPGQDLNQRVAARGKLSNTEGQALMRQIASALHAMQLAGTAHGNMSATNVFFCRHDDLAVDSPLSDGKGTYRLVLIDPGLSTLDGNTPSVGDDQRALGRMINAFVADLSPSVRQVLERAQEPNPDARFRTIADFWRFFDEANNAKPGTGPRAAGRAVATTVVPSLKFDPKAIAERRRPYILGGAAALGVVVVAVVALLAGRKPTGPAAPLSTGDSTGIAADSAGKDAGASDPKAAADSGSKDPTGKPAGTAKADDAAPDAAPDAPVDPKAGKGKKKKGKKAR